MSPYEPRNLLSDSPVPVEIVETDIDLYYHMAYSLYLLLEENSGKHSGTEHSATETVVIMPVGPVFQYRRLIYFLKQRPLDLSRLHCFFMDEYLSDSRHALPVDHPLSFRGFIRRELIEPMPDEFGLRDDHVYFPNPQEPEAYDRLLESLGGAQVCFAGVGINGHLAFNEADRNGMTPERFRSLPSRVLELSRETVTINSNTALGGAIEMVPRFAVTIGFKQIYESRAIRIYMNRPWQRAVVRKMLWGPESAEFPASLVMNHPDVRITITEEVAKPPEFALK